MTYTPLDAVLDANVTVIFGSNMGGKTVALKSFAFLQACAQTGLFVPAVRFETRLFKHFHYLGEGAAKEETQGLSGFGFEIRQFVEASKLIRPGKRLGTILVEISALDAEDLNRLNTLVSK